MATVALITVLVLPFVLALQLGSLEINRWTRWAWLAFSLLMLPEILRLARSTQHLLLVRCYAGLLVVSLFAWEASYGPGYLFAIPATYLLIPLFTAAAWGWFQAVGTRGIAIVFFTKYLTGAVVFLLFLSFIVTRSGYGDEALYFLHPPFFRHIRHANYELLALVALLLLAVDVKAIKFSVISLVLLPLFGFFVAWSGGRGGALALLVLFVLLALFRHELRSSLFRVAAALLAGCIIAFILHKGAILYAPGLDRSASFDVSQGFDSVSSGRLGIWKGSLTYWVESWSTLLFGRGPDAFVNFGINRVVYPDGYLVQPHNMVVQWLLDFGLLGLLLSVAVLARALRPSAQSPHQKSVSQQHPAAALLILVYLVFSLSDGLLHHAAPLSVFMLILAFHMSRLSVR